MKQIFRILLVINVIASINAALAHHGTFTFDADTIVTLQGKVVRFNWTNPHSSLVLAVTGPDGRQREYFVEADGPSILAPLGVTRESLRPGDTVIAHVSPSRLEKSSSVLGREVIKEDGSVLGLSVAFARQRERIDPPEATGLLGTWVPDQRSLFAFVQSRDAWKLTPAGQATLAAYDIRAPFSQTACIPATAPTLLMYPTAKVLSDQGTHLELDADWMGAVRTLYMDGRAHPPRTETYLQGHSTARWEGTSLLIETTNFAPNAIGNTFGVASSPGKVLLETLALDPGGSSLTYSFTLSDPEYLQESVTGSYRWDYRPDVKGSTEPCDLDAASRHLSGD